MKSIYTLGTDPELMVADRTGKIVSAIPVVGRDKYDPLDYDGIKVYYDNTMIEATTIPAASKESFISSIRDAFECIHGVIGDDFSIVTVPSSYFSEEECLHPDAIVSGCAPEFCAYKAEMCFPPEFEDTFRSAGGHIHIGRSDFEQFSEGDAEKNKEFLLSSKSKLKIIKLMDVFVGCPMTLLDNSEASLQRKRLYGKAGRFRPTDYGVEYRTPSNFWLSSPKTAELIWDLTMMALESAKGNSVKSADCTKAFNAINSDDDAVALELVEKHIPSELCEKIKALRDASFQDIREEWSVASLSGVA